MTDYHDYVFDEKKRRFVGRFEEMYAAERTGGGFDSWHQEDFRHMDRGICLLILERFNFDTILDVGCGKGMFTHLLKKKNNYVVGADISKTALNIARARYPDVEFRVADLKSVNWKPIVLEGVTGRFDLVVCREILSYIDVWEILLRDFSEIAKNILLSLFVPDEPMGFVESLGRLRFVFQEYFNIEEEIRLNTQKEVVLFGCSKSRSIIEG